MVVDVLATTLRFLTTLSVVHQPEFWVFDPDLPDRYLPKLLDREKLFVETQELLALAPGWPAVFKRDGIVVRSQFLGRYGRNGFMTEVTLPGKPERMCDIFKEGVAGVAGIPEWNPMVESFEDLKIFDDSTWVSWQVTKSQLGGLISARESLVVHFCRRVPEEQGSAYWIVYTNSTWPTRPPTDEFVRGENGSSVLAFSPTPGTQPGETHSRLSWVVNADLNLSAFIPMRVVNRIFPSLLLDYARALRKHVSETPSLRT